METRQGEILFISFPDLQKTPTLNRRCVWKRANENWNKLLKHTKETDWSKRNCSQQKLQYRKRDVKWWRQKKPRNTCLRSQRFAFVILTHDGEKNVARGQHHLLPGGPVIDSHMAFIRSVVWDPHLWEPAKNTKIHSLSNYFCINLVFFIQS